MRYSDDAIGIYPDPDDAFSFLAKGFGFRRVELRADFRRMVIVNPDRRARRGQRRVWRRCALCRGRQGRFRQWSRSAPTERHRECAAAKYQEK